MQEPAAFQGNDRFQIRRCLGSGGFGTVYEAFDRKRSAVVAIKVLRRTSPSGLYGFKQEFRLLSGIEHPNLVTLYELLCEGERWFFTMEFVPGTDFLTHVRDGALHGGAGAALTPSDSLHAGPATLLSTQDLSEGFPGAAGDLPVTVYRPRAFSPDRLLRALLHLAGGLMTLHAAGIVHRDIKPANVLCTEEGRVVLLDFGLVQNVASSPGLGSALWSENGSRDGTPDYMSPEQAAAQPATAASDWYSVGVMLYEALTGRVPFLGTMQQVLRQKIAQDAPPLSLDADSLPAALVALCMQLLARDPARRPSGEEIIARLRELEAGLLRPTAVEALRDGRQGSAGSDQLFIGRNRQLASLAAAFTANREGQAVVVLCHGDSGVGKSLLCRQFLKELLSTEKDLVLLAGRCHANEDVPFKALDGVIDSLSRFLSQRPREETLALLPRDISAAARLFPVLLQVAAIREVPAQRIADDLQAKQAAFAALRELASRLAAQQPLLLFIDDLQWGDPDGLSLLLELLRPPDPPRLLLIVAYRSEEESSSAALQLLRRGLTSDLGRRVASFDVALDALSEKDAEALALRLLPEDQKERAAFIAVESGGNPFFIEELSRASVQDAQAPSAGGAELGKTGSLDALIRARVAKLPQAQQRLLSAVALAGQPVARAATAIAAYGDTVETDEPQALARLRAERLLRVRHASSQGGAREELLVYHDRIREAVVAGLSPADAAAQHLRLVSGLLAVGHAEPEQLVFHLQRGGDLDGAARYAVEASAQAYKSLAYHQAVRLCRVALGTGKLTAAESLIIKSRLADALVGSGYPKEAAEVYLELAEYESKERAFERRRQAAKQFFISGHVSEGSEVLRSLLPAARLRMPRTSLGCFLSMVFHQLLIAARGLEFQARPDSEVTPADLLRLDTCEAIASSTSQNPLLAADFATKFLWHALRAGEPRRISVALSGVSGFLCAFGGPRAITQKLLARAIEVGEQEEYSYGLARCTFIRGQQAWLEGRWQESLVELGRSVEILRNCVDSTALIDYSGSLEIFALRWMGRMQQLAERIQPYLKDAVERGRKSQEMNVRLGGGFMLLLREDEPERAEEFVQTALLRLAQPDASLPQYFGLDARLLILLYRGRAQDAWQLFCERRRGLERSGILRMVLIGALWAAQSALVALASGQPLSTVAAAERRLSRSGCHFAGPLSMLVRALSQRRLGNHAQCLLLLRRAEEELSSCAMSLHAACIRFRRGQWQGGPAGESDASAAREWMRREGIRSPERMAAMLVPDPIVK